MLVAAAKFHISPKDWWDDHFLLRHATAVVLACRQIIEEAD